MSLVLFGTVSQCCDATSILDGIIDSDSYLYTSNYAHFTPFDHFIKTNLWLVNPEREVFPEFLEWVKKRVEGGVAGIVRHARENLAKSAPTVRSQNWRTGKKELPVASLNDYRTHVHMGSDHWVAFLCPSVCTFLKPCEDLVKYVNFVKT